MSLPVEEAASFQSTDRGFRFDRKVLSDPWRSGSLEWLETNGLGGWAGSTLSGANTRRYHGLLVAAAKPPRERLVLLSKLEETIVFNGNRYELGCNHYPGVTHPQGYLYLDRFTKDLFPRFEYEAGGVRLCKTVAALWGENTTLIQYEVLKAPGSIFLELRPLVAGRHIHGLVQANDQISRQGVFSNGLFRVTPYPGIPEVFIFIPGADFSPGPGWYFNFEYPAERERGLDFQEDLFSHGSFRLTLDPGAQVTVAASTTDPTGGDTAERFARERRRRERIVSSLSRKSRFARRLSLAADQFLVQGQDGCSTVIAGYHWFEDWGRDTMIALPGIALDTGRHQEARQVLESWAARVSRGMLPNRFPDDGQEPEYNTADASLWFFVAVFHYLKQTGDRDFVQTRLLPEMRDILLWHERGTRYNIRVDTDGLLSAGGPGLQLTWMDARVGDKVVTPRSGKAVEINALWYNALRIQAQVLTMSGDGPSARACRRLAAGVKMRFNEVFWCGEAGHLYDCIHGENRDRTLRPNQVFALSLPFPLVSGTRAEQVLRVLEERLLTPFGLRTLDPGHHDYHACYRGGPAQRDAAYHQGTVWPWLLGPYIDALVRVRGDVGKRQAGPLLSSLADHLCRAGVGSVSEIFDAEPPHEPRGCIAQAWSVAELLRVCMEHGLG